MNIHDLARRLVAQSLAPLSLHEAYSRLSRRRRRKSTYGRTAVQSGAFTNIERPANYRPPYNDL